MSLSAPIAILPVSAALTSPGGMLARIAHGARITGSFVPAVLPYRCERIVLAKPTVRV